MPIIKSLESDPKKLFLLDGLGAMLSAFLLGVVLVQFEKVFGIPPSTLYFLATLPILFAAYDFFCFQKNGDQLGPFLKLIAMINVLYCCLSIGFSLYHLETITKFGWAYILCEVVIVLILAGVEFRVAQRLMAKNGK